MHAASVVSSTLPARRRLSRSVQPSNQVNRMKTIVCSMLLAAIAVGQCSAFDYSPMMAERPKSPEAISAGIASSSSLYFKQLDAPDSLKSVRAFIATYRTGVDEPAGTGGSSFSSNTPEWKRKLAVSVAVRMQDSPKYVPGKGCPDSFVPGTGSTFIGMSFMSYLDTGGHSGSGTQAIIQNSEIDMMKMVGPLDPSKLPVEIETRATREQHAIPVFVWLPQSFDPTKMPKKLTASDLPDGTIIAYAVIN